VDEEPKYRNYGWLYREYYLKQRTVTDIADELDVDHTTISKWRRRLDIPKLSRTETLTCPVCDTEFSRAHSRIKRAKNVNVCSRSCLHTARQEGLLDWRGSIINGDARDLSAVPDESVELVVTSPPYYQTASDEQNQDGSLNIDIDAWDDLLADTLDELYRVTKPDAKVCIVVGTAKTSADDRTRQFDLSAHTYTHAIEAGFDFFDQIIWQKPTYGDTGGDRPLFGSYPYPPNLLVVQNHEVIQVFRKWESDEYHSQRTQPKAGSKRKEASKLSKDEWKEWTQSVWEIEPVRFSEYHDPFPEEIPRRLIRMYSFVDDTVLDPFIGSGTTAVGALKEQREYVGYELRSNRCETARQRIAETKQHTE
jgi:DNA modification methylase/transposase-like protein